MFRMQKFGISPQSLAQSAASLAPMASGSIASGSITADRPEACRDLADQLQVRQSFLQRLDVVLPQVLYIETAQRRIYAGASLESLLGYGQDQTLGQLVHPEDAPQMRRHRQQLALREAPLSEGDYRFQTSAGHWRWLRVRETILDAESDRILGTAEDVTDRKVLQQELTYQAGHDSLTHLPNRSALLERLTAACEEQPRPSALLLLAVDRLRPITDSLGHRVGDRLLQEIAQRIQGCLHPQDYLARWGDDAFVVLMAPYYSDAGVLQVATHIQEAVAAPIDVDDRDLFTTLSIGITPMSPGRDADRLLAQATAAMAQAQSQTQAPLGHTRVFEAEMLTDRLASQQLEQDLRRSLEQGGAGLCVHYQPIMSLEHGRLMGFEALVRWHHPDRGFLLPGTFIDLAEETNLIVPLGLWVLRSACWQLRDWHDRAGNENLYISVNLSARQLTCPNLLPQIRQVLTETGLSSNNLRLELTESSLIEDPTQAAVTLRCLRAMGIQLSVDDFGTGYSSLSYLNQFPIDVLKIDRSFVEYVDDEGEPSSIIEGIIHLSKSLGLRTIAEGVATVKQLAHLRSLGCEQAQGSYFAMPLALDQATEWVIQAA
jgi:diguanylate cyclase (GGDEF)-like protein/PAS domain S-box-containing protein